MKVFCIAGNACYRTLNLGTENTVRGACCRGWKERDCSVISLRCLTGILVVFGDVSLHVISSATKHFAFFLLYVKIALKLILSLRKRIKIKTVISIENKQTEDKGRRKKWTKEN